MNTQLDLLTYRSADPAATESGRFANYLYGRGWVNARQIKSEQGWPERSLREWAAASDGQIISGQRGYCRIEEATPEEIHRAHTWLRSQAREMLRRSVAIRRRAHGLIR